MKKFVCILCILLCANTILRAQDAQALDFDYLYEVQVLITDTTIVGPFGNQELMQRYQLLIPNYDPNMGFNIDEIVGFKISAQYRSTLKISEPIQFIINYVQHVDSDHAFFGALKPITIPPVDDEVNQNPEFPFNPPLEYLVFNSMGEKPLLLTLNMTDSTGADIELDTVEGSFVVKGQLQPSGENHPGKNFNQIEVFPNPLQQQLYIKTADTKAKTTKLSIYTMGGEMRYSSILQGQVQEDTEGITYRFENPYLGPGLYYYVIEIGDKIYTKILQKE